MRLPLAANLESRDGTVTKDAKIVNGIVESSGGRSVVRSRPGIADIGSLRAGAAQLLTYWRGIRAVIGDYLTTGFAQSIPSATFNPADKLAAIALSNGNLTITQTGSVGFARSTASTTVGWYAEFQLQTSGGGSGCRWGMANSSATISSALGADNNGIGYLRNGNVFKNGATLATGLTALNNGDYMGVYYDGSSIRFYVNNVLQYTASGSNVPTGALFMAAGDSAAGVTITTANFGATAFVYSPSIVSTNLSPTTAGLQFDSEFNGANAATEYLMIKNATQAWTVDTNNAVSQITDTDFPGSYTVPVVSITRSGSTATATLTGDANIKVNAPIVIAGAGQAEYNGSKTVLSYTAGVSATSQQVRINITRSGSTATAVTAAVSEVSGSGGSAASYPPHGFTNGQSVVISGASQPEYNGTFAITYIDAASFSFTVTTTTTTGTVPGASTIASPASVVGSMSLAEQAQISGFSVNAGDTSATGALVLPRKTVIVGDQIVFPTNVGPIAAGTYSITALTPTSPSAGFYSITISIPAAAYSSPNIGSGFVALVVLPTITSITNSLGIATVTSSSAHGLQSDMYVDIAGATPSGYNGRQRITVRSSTTFTYQLQNTESTTSTVTSPATPATGIIYAQKPNTSTAPTFTFTVSGSPVTPATGTITAQTNKTTVRGIAYINGYFVVMDQYGVVYTSDIDNPRAWSALDYTIAQNETGDGRALSKSQNYIVAFKEFSTELFYDAGNAIGSPLSPVENGFLQIGCASGDSVALLDGNLFWLSQVRQRGRSVHMMLGLENKKVSTPDVDRILNADSLSTVRAYGCKLDGHPLYVLTLAGSNITLVYDLSTDLWTQWTSLTIGSSRSVTSITRDGTTATVTTGTAHGVSDGDPVTISGANQSEYNGTFQASYVSATVFTIQVTGTPATGTGTILAFPYTESYFKFTKYANLNGADGFLHESIGNLYTISTSSIVDGTAPVNTLIRTVKLDSGTTDRKKMGRIIVVGEQTTTSGMLRWSDDDYQTYSAYQRFSLSDVQPMVRRCGAYRRRAIDLKYNGATAMRVDALELGE